MMVFFLGCDNWFERQPKTGEMTKSKPVKGSDHDVTVYWKNNCENTLIVYAIQIAPGSSFNCDQLEYYGSVSKMGNFSYVIPKGKIAFFAFAETTAGQCTGGQRKAEYWVNTENSTATTANFPICN